MSGKPTSPDDPKVQAILDDWTRQHRPLTASLRRMGIIGPRRTPAPAATVPATDNPLLKTARAMGYCTPAPDPAPPASEADLPEGSRRILAAARKAGVIA